MRIKVVLSLLKKEFLNIIRDRKSFITMILLPLLMFPILIGLMGLMISMFTKVDDTISFGVNYEVSEDFKDFVENYSDVYKFEIVYEDEDKLKEMFDDEDLGIYVINEDNEYFIHYDENNTSSIANSALVEKIYQDYKQEYVAKTLEQQGVNYQDILDSFKITFVQESITEMGSLVPSMISMVLTMMISSVCFSVAIEITTSEKEKGTLETLLSLPIKKSELITSKYLTVFILSSLSGFLTYISLFGTLYFAKDTLAMLGVVSLEISGKVLAIYFISIILLALLFSGLLLSVTIFSKNLKEAQNSLYPLELLVAFISMLPMFGITGSLKSSLIPFVNISLLFNNALSTNVDSLFVLLTFISTLAYSIILIFIVSKIYNQEDVLFSTNSLKYLSFRKGKVSRDCLSPLGSLVLGIVIYLLATYFTLLFATSSMYFLLAIMPITILFISIAVCLISQIDIKKSIKFNGFSIKKFIVLTLLFIAIYFISSTIINVIANFFPSTIEQYSQVSELLNVNNIWLGLLLIAVLPAIAEEFFFRGIVLNSFKKKYGIAVGIIASALIFGIYHMNWIQGINAFIVGIALGYIYVKSGSILTTMILHFINNAYGVLCEFYPSLNFNPSGVTFYIVIAISIITLIVTFHICETKFDKKN